MNSFDRFLRWALSILVVCTMAFALGACDGDDGKDGTNGRDGVDGTDGAPAPVPDAIMAAIDSAQVESCATCHSGVGDDHQAIYDSYVDASALELTLNSVSSSAGGPPHDVTLSFSITENGLPFVDAAGLPSLDQKRFYMVRWDSTAGLNGQYLEGNQRLREDNVIPGAAPGDYLLTQTDMPFAPELSDAHVYGYIADGVLFTHEGASSELPAGSHVHLYDNVSNAALAFGEAAVGDPNAYVSAANVEGCEKCHGTPYLKHGYRAAQAAGLPEFAACKSCHYDDRGGNHSDWQYMVDEPFNWATGVAETADYSYRATVMNDTHMSHAMEFPYPMSMANCNTCHEGKLDIVLADANFTVETCKSCHPIQGIDAWPEDAGATLEGDYAQAHRAPPMDFIWTKAEVEGFAFHNPTEDCTACHEVGGIGSAFTAYHTGYDSSIYNASGEKYSDLFPVTIDQVTLDGDLLTVNFSGDATVVPELLVSFYGWDTKNFIVGSHERDGNGVDCPHASRPGCKMEYVPESSGGSANPLFTEDPASVAGTWMVTLDMAGLQTVKTDDIPTLIANGDVTMAEISITPELEVDGADVVLLATSEAFDLGGSVIVDDYFAGANATVDLAKCNACHDSLASSFHDGSGRGGDGIQVCKTCHTTTFPGSHLEMASRAIDSYVHAIHSFQPFDLDDIAAADDPVEDARLAQHVNHTFPNFTIRNCESCHLAGTYNVPDQAQSMPGVLSASWDIADRNIGSVPEAVTGPASRACGGCHRADLINPDLAGDLAAFNAHTEQFGTFAENDDDDAVLFGIIDKIMTWFE
ncbi:MAG: hypothetical protein QNK16_00820 [Woeseiaceae bacterium]|nr:hypothetical protein [Woeseiaceae bacterium]MDX2606899.1 hypothetical protein [Woeseiaceae bacterium]